MDSVISGVGKRALLTAIISLCSSSSYKVAEEVVLHGEKGHRSMPEDDLMGGKEVGVGKVVTAFSRGLRFQK